MDFLTVVKSLTLPSDLRFRSYSPVLQGCSRNAQAFLISG